MKVIFRSAWMKAFKLNWNSEGTWLQLCAPAEEVSRLFELLMRIRDWAIATIIHTGCSKVV
jgi:hypothetical protein